MSLIRKHVAVLQAWACLDLVGFVGDDLFETIASGFWDDD